MRLAMIDPKDYPDDNVSGTFHSYDPFLLTHQGATWAGDFIRYVTGLPYPALCRAARRTRRGARSASARRCAPRRRGRGAAGMLAYLDEQIADHRHQGKARRAAWTSRSDIVAAWAKTHGIAPEDILLGEFGMIRQEYGNAFVMPAASRAAYDKDMIEHAESTGFAWSMWCYGGAFGVVEEFEGKKAEPDVMEMVRGLK